MDEVDEYVDDLIDDCDESTTVECPNCGEQVYEDAEQCPLCQQYIVPDFDNHYRSTRFSILTKIVIWLLIVSLVLPAVILFIDRLW